jgi:hypothetical protein
MTWNRHGMILLAFPEHSILINITICMAVHPQPGPENVHNKTNGVSSKYNDRVHNGFAAVGREKLLSLRKLASKPSACDLAIFKMLGF